MVKNRTAADLLIIPPLCNALESVRETAAAIRRYAYYEGIFRRIAGMRWPSTALTCLPFIDPYCRNLRDMRNGLDHAALLRTLFECEPLLCQPHVLQPHAAIEGRRLSFENGDELTVEAVKAPPSVEIFRQVPTIKLFEDRQGRAVAELERILRMARHSDPVVAYGLLSSLLPEIGRMSQGFDAGELAGLDLASLLAEHHSGMQEWMHAERVNRSFISLDRPLRHNNVIPFDRHRRRPLSQRQLLIRIVALASTQRLPEPALREIEQIVRSYAADAVYDAECY